MTKACRRARAAQRRALVRTPQMKPTMSDVRLTSTSVAMNRKNLAALAWKPIML